MKKTWCWDDEMEIQELKRHSRERMAKANEYSSEDGSNSELETCIQPEPVKGSQDSTTIIRKYHDLLNSLDDTSTDNSYNSFLLPSFLPTSDNVTVNVKGVKDPVLKTVTEISASKFIHRIVEERDDAVKLTMHYRNLVEDLQSKNRKLYCTMNDSIDTVRNFWRNNILESGTRGGLCVKKALENNAVS